MVWACCPKCVLCCINSLKIFVCEAVTNSWAIPVKKTNSGGGGGGGGGEGGGGRVEEMELPGGLKK